MNVLNKTFLSLIIFCSTNIFPQSLSIKNQSFKIGEKKSIALEKVDKMNCSLMWVPDNPNMGFIKNSNGESVGSIGFNENDELIGLSKDWDSFINYNDITSLFEAIFIVSKKVFGDYSDVGIKIEELTEPHAKHKSIELSTYTTEKFLVYENVVSINLFNDTQLHVNQRLNLVK